MKTRRRASVILIVLVVLVVLLVAALVVGWYAYRRCVVEEPGERFTRAAIMDIISEESPVYYRDGQTRFGVFFAREHRDYVPYREIPDACVAAIVAAEDKRFFDHHGVDPMGITRAMVMNAKAGHLVAGGSTLTQQTAKNLYYRPDRSLRSKGTELVNALRLEAHFSKQDILEFYFNQFHVSGNGRGIGIAARYFFDRDVGQLGLHECAFLAGMVKAPSRYNPWLGHDEEARQKARDAARIRTTYVLGRMAETGAIPQERYLALKDQPIPFQRGTFRYDRSVVLDAVEQALAEAPFPEVFAAAGIDNPSAAGLQIVTTLDEGAQTAATWGLWHHLTELGPYLDGADATAFLLDEDALSGPLVGRPRPRQFLTARVGQVRGEGKQRRLSLDLGPAPLARGGDAAPTGHLACTVDHQGLLRAAAVVRQSKELDHRRSAREDDVTALLGVLRAGRVVRASVREDADDGLVCDLEARTALQGAVLVLQQGRVRAMVGGNDNQNFNRATQARRQLGSTWKPLVYYAALQLGWQPGDLLDNRRGVFPFEGTWYYPHPDHDPEPAVTLAWAGTRSENLASIWLLYHLVDRLNPEQLRRVAELTGLAQAGGEDREAYIARIRDQYGVIPLESRIPEALFDDARLEALGGLAFSGHPEDAFELRSLHYGRLFEAERLRVQRGSRGDERRQRLEALDRSFLHLEPDGLSCRDQLARLGSPMELALNDHVVEGVAPGDVGWLHLRSRDGTLVCAPEAQPGLEPLAAVLDDPEALATWVGRAHPDRPGDMLVDGVLHLSTIEALRTALDAEVAKHGQEDPWSEYLLLRNADFKRLLGMRYIALLAHSMGVETDIPPVLSMPLGATEITLLEMAEVYQGFLDGASWRFPGQVFTDGAVPGLRQASDVPADGRAALLIQEIRDRDGAVLYRAGEQKVQIASAHEGLLVTDVLANVVSWGTGRRAAGTVQVGGAAWPLLGKTGTTNAYRNAAFIGFVPVTGEQGLDMARSFTVASYVGYDDNRPMRRGSLRVSGASGALPAWIGTAQGMAGAGLLGSEPAPGSSLSPASTCLVRQPVDKAAGLPLDGAGEEGGPTILVPGPECGASRAFVPLTPPRDRVWSGQPGWEQPAEVVEEAAEGPTEEPSQEDPGEGASVWDVIEQGR
ncbi:MAG: transglycosylase domain-containing protein [Pseudomonadota bacterium]